MNGLILAAIQAEAEKELLLPLSLKQIRRAQKDDSPIDKIMEAMVNEKKPSKEDRNLEGSEF